VCVCVQWGQVDGVCRAASQREQTAGAHTHHIHQTHVRARTQVRSVSESSHCDGRLQVCCYIWAESDGSYLV